MSRTLEQFIRFTTDAVGLERTFRLFQALAQIFTSYGLAFGLLQHLLALTTTTAAAEKPPSEAALRGVLVGLAHHLALARRFLRLFRFLESFGAAHKLYLEISAGASPPPPPPPTEQPGEKMKPRRRHPAAVHAEQWLDVLARSFNGMYLLLEASVLADALGVEGLAPWGPVAAARVAREAQRFWLFALLCAVLSGALRIFAVFAYTAVPEPVRPPPPPQQQHQDGAGTAEGEGGEKWDLRAEQARLREVVARRRLAQSAWRRQVLAKVRRLARGVLANALDIALPGTAVGWLDFAPGTVAVAMFATSVLTGLDVWERCGREVAALG